MGDGTLLRLPSYSDPRMAWDAELSKKEEDKSPEQPRKTQCQALHHSAKSIRWYILIPRVKNFRRYLESQGEQKTTFEKAASEGPQKLLSVESPICTVTGGNTCFFDGLEAL